MIFYLKSPKHTKFHLNPDKSFYHLAFISLHTTYVHVARVIYFAMVVGTQFNDRLLVIQVLCKVLASSAFMTVTWFMIIEKFVVEAIFCYSPSLAYSGLVGRQTNGLSESTLVYGLYM